jgi:hypothetical protein
MLMFYHIFYICGYGDQHTNEEWEGYQKNKLYKAFKPLTLYLMLICMVITVPGYHYLPSEGNVWIYPIYTLYYERVLYVLGTWV